MARDSELASFTLQQLALCADEWIDGPTMKILKNFNDLSEICPTVAKGHLFKVFKHLKSNFSKSPELSESSSSVGTGTIDENSGDDTDPADDEQTACSSIGSSSSTSTDDVPNLISERPIPKIFPIEICNFGYHTKEVIRTGILSEVGKREITTEIITTMKKFERYAELLPSPCTSVECNLSLTTISRCLPT